VVLVVLPERRSIDGDDGTFDQGFGSDHFVGYGVVNDVDDPGLPGATFGSPAKVTRVEAEGSELSVATHGSDGVDSDIVVVDEFGVGLLSTEFKLSFFVHLGLAATSGTAFVP